MTVGALEQSSLCRCARATPQQLAPQGFNDFPQEAADSDSGISDTDVIASGSDAGDEDSDNDRKDDDDAESPEPMEEEEEEEEAFEVELAEVTDGAGNAAPPPPEQGRYSLLS